MAKPGHTHCGDYGYIQGNVPEHSKKIEDGELYVKVAIKDIFYREINNHSSFTFSMEVMNKDNTCSYGITVTEPERLTEITWEYPDKIMWSVKQNY